MQRHFNFIIQYSNLKHKLWYTPCIIRLSVEGIIDSLHNEITCTLNICSKWYWLFYARSSRLYWNRKQMLTKKKNPCHFTLFISQLLSVKLNKFAKKCKTISLLRHQNKNWVRLKKSLTIIKLNYTIQDLKYYTKETIKTNHNFLAIFVKDILKLRYVSWNPWRGHLWT